MPNRVKLFTMYLHFLVVPLNIGITLGFKIKYVDNYIFSSENPFSILMIHFHDMMDLGIIKIIIHISKQTMINIGKTTETETYHNLRVL